MCQAHLQELGQAGPSHPRLVWFFFGTSRFSEAATDTEPSLGGYLDSLQTSWPGLLGTRTLEKTHRCAKLTFRSWDKLDQAIQGWCGTSLVHPDFLRLLTYTEPSLGGFLTSWPGLLGTRTQKKLIGVSSSPSGAGTSWTKPSKAVVVLLWYIQDFLRLLQTPNQAWVASWTASKQAGRGC